LLQLLLQLLLHLHLLLLLLLRWCHCSALPSQLLLLLSVVLPEHI
jgi:hypothetical protein